MLNRDIYNKAPQENRLVNNGVAEVSEDHSDAAQAILRYELETFVCDGQYEKGIETILDKFLLNLGNKAEQPGVWISGFYGSGKSHLAKMLRTLWTDYAFAEGATARSIARLGACLTPSTTRREYCRGSTLFLRAMGVEPCRDEKGRHCDGHVRARHLRSGAWSGTQPPS